MRPALRFLAPAALSLCLLFAPASAVPVQRDHHDFAVDAAPDAAPDSVPASAAGSAIPAVRPHLRARSALDAYHHQAGLEAQFLAAGPDGEDGAGAEVAEAVVVVHVHPRAVNATGPVPGVASGTGIVSSSGASPTTTATATATVSLSGGTVTSTPPVRTITVVPAPAGPGSPPPPGLAPEAPLAPLSPPAFPVSTPELSPSPAPLAAAASRSARMLFFPAAVGPAPGQTTSTVLTTTTTRTTTTVFATTTVYTTVATSMATVSTRGTDGSVTARPTPVVVTQVRTETVLTTKTVTGTVDVVVPTSGSATGSTRASGSATTPGAGTTRSGSGTGTNTATGSRSASPLAGATGSFSGTVSSWSSAPSSGTSSARSSGSSSGSSSTRASGSPTPATGSSSGTSVRPSSSSSSSRSSVSSGSTSSSRSSVSSGSTSASRSSVSSPGAQTTSSSRSGSAVTSGPTSSSASRTSSAAATSPTGPFITITLRPEPTTVTVRVTTTVPGASGTVITTITSTTGLPFPTQIVTTTTTVSIPASVSPLTTVSWGYTTPTGTATMSSGTTTPTTFGTSVSPTSSKASTTTTTSPSSTTATTSPTVSSVAPAASADIFAVAIAGSNPAAPPVPVRQDHPVARRGIDATGPVGTNKFYGNLLVGTQRQAVWTHPYSVWWPKGQGMTNSWGLAIAHIDPNQRVFGPGSPAEYYINPIGIQSLILSAGEIDSSAELRLSDPRALSVNADFYKPGTAGSSPVMQVPLVQGMGFVTAKYNSAQPLIRSGIQFRRLDAVYDVQSAAGADRGDVPPGVGKFRATLMDGSVWVIYITPGNGATGSGSGSGSGGATTQTANNMVLTLEGSGTIRGPANFSGTVQVAKVPRQAPAISTAEMKQVQAAAAPELSSAPVTALSSVSAAEVTYDQSAGSYVTGGKLTASASGEYTFTWRRAGLPVRPLLMFALPHHLDSMTGFDRATTSIELQSTTKGVLTGVLADKWVLKAPMPAGLDLSPLSATTAFTAKSAALARRADNSSAARLEQTGGVSNSARSLIALTASAELAVDMSQYTDLGSHYFSGKAFAKYAQIIVTAQEVAGDSRLAAAGLSNLKVALDWFVTNRNAEPLYYDSVWGGVVSGAGYRDVNADFGNTNYNDHHFHFGYFVYVAAVIAKYDPAWLTAEGGKNRRWVEMLLRDFANPVEDDPYFPQSRAFDWYHGHSWAKGLFESADGKDQESSSEDVFAAYAIQMWGKAVGDANTEARGALMLGILSQTVPKYFLMSSGSTVHPANFIENKVTGILFENKVHHTTYFGAKPEFIQGIHMLPLSPASAISRPASFVQEEWDRYFSNGRALQAEGGWKGILMGNRALADPTESWNYFSGPQFNSAALDGGASRTWYLAMAAALGART